MGVQSIHPIKIFYCYAHEDDVLREQLTKHLSPLRRLRDITGWFDRDVLAGGERERESKEHLDTASIILLLISADFMASDYCYTVEMTHALERHRAGTACVIPILLRPVEWERTPISELSPLPTNRTPVTQWANPDAAWLNVVQGISDIVRKLLPKQLLSLQDTDILYTEQGPLSGQIIGENYLLGELIGEGGFSQVYKAQHLLIQRRQAVKVLLERHFRKLEFRDRFLREARTVASLEHPHIITLHDYGVEASQAYLVMPYMSGGTLQDILEKQQGFLERDQIVFYLEHICAALDYAHKQGIVHLDLKPLNLLIHENGRLLLSDFGLAHLMKNGAIAGGSSLRVGTPHYMAPEHIKGFPERRSDLFSLGVILYQMLVGRLPFDGLPHEAILIKNMIEWPPAPRVIRPELPQSVEDMLGKALAKQPEQRYQTANEFLIAFKNALVSNLACQSVMPLDHHNRAAGEVTLVHLLEKEFLPVTNGRQVMYLLLEAKPTSLVAQVRMPLNFALVVDHSGSMRGAKLKNMREAVKMVIDRLEPTDYISVVIFSDTAQVIIPSMPANDKPGMKVAIDRIQDAGEYYMPGMEGADRRKMSLGMIQGIGELRRCNIPNAIHRMILLTDGVNYGDTDRCRQLARDAAANGISIYPLGIGTNWDENLLDDIGQLSGGSPAEFIRRPADAMTIFEQQVQSAVAVAVRNAVLTVRLPVGVMPRSAVKVLPIIREIDSSALSDRQVVVPLGDLENDTAQSVLIELMIDPRQAGLVRIARAELTYDVPVTSTYGACIRDDITVTFTSDANQIAQVNPQVMTLVESSSPYRITSRNMQKST